MDPDVARYARQYDYAPKADYDSLASLRTALYKGPSIVYAVLEPGDATRYMLRLRTDVRDAEWVAVERIAGGWHRAADPIGTIVLAFHGDPIQRAQVWPLCNDNVHTAYILTAFLHILLKTDEVWTR